MGTTIDLSNPEVLEHFVTGLAFFGTGGGFGRVEDGIAMLRPLAGQARTVTLASADELPDDTWTCSVSSFGGRDPDTPPPAAELATYGLVAEKHTVVERMMAAVKELEAYAGVRIGALVSVELGAATAATMVAAHALGIPTIDSDYVGRAKPEIGQSKIAMHGKRRTPMVFADRWGNVSIVKSTVTDLMADRLGRHLSMAAYGRGVGTAGHLFRLGDARAGMVRGSVLRAIPVGRALTDGRQQRDRLGPLVKEIGGGVLFEGTAVATDWESDEPYTFRTFTYRVKGTGRCAGQHCRIWVKNEHHVVWRDEEVVGTSPDLLVVLDAMTNRPLSTRGEVTPGRDIVVFGADPLDAEWRSPPGIALLGPRHFGFDFDHVPLGILGE